MTNAWSGNTVEIGVLRGQNSGLGADFISCFVPYANFLYHKKLLMGRASLSLICFYLSYRVPNCKQNYVTTQWRSWDTVLKNPKPYYPWSMILLLIYLAVWSPAPFFCMMTQVTENKWLVYFFVKVQTWAYSGDLNSELVWYSGHGL